MFVVSYVVRDADCVRGKNWPDNHSLSGLLPGWFSPPLIALDAGMDLVNTFTQASDPWTGRFWSYSKDCLMLS